MLIFKYSKIGGAAYIPHTDSLRAIIRTMRRAEIPVNYSEGFNPHMNLYMSPPIPLGIESESEYCAVDTEIDAKEFAEKYNSSCIRGMECLKAYNVFKNPNMAANISAAKYLIKSKTLSEKFSESWLSGTFEVTIEREGKTSVKEVSKEILGVKKVQEGIEATLSFGNGGNLRADRFADALKTLADGFECVIIKKDCYCNTTGGLVLADSFIEAFLKK